MQNKTGAGSMEIQLILLVSDQVSANIEKHRRELHSFMQNLKGWDDAL